MQAQTRLSRRIKNPSVDIVHAHLLKTVVVARLAVRNAHRPALVSQMPGTVHFESPILSAIDRVTMHWDSALVASCNDFAEKYTDRGARKVFTNHYGCTTGLLDPDTPRGPFRREQRLDDDTIAVGMIAHMYPTRLKAFQDVGVKGHESFIDAAALLSRSNAHAFQFFIVGDEFAGDGAYRQQLEERSARSGMSNRIHFLGHRTDVQNVIAGLDILTNPSLSESASYTMIESSLMRKPVVATAVGGLKDTVLDGTTGLRVPPDDPESLALAIHTLATDTQLRDRLGAAGREHVISLFDISRTVDELERIYAAVAGGPDA